MPRHRIAAPDRRRQILDVATGLFAVQGFQGTKTREIAARAGVNEALVFRHFPTKQKLYAAVLESLCHAGDAEEKFHARLRGDAPVQDVLASIAEDILRRNSEDDTFVRLWLFSGLENHGLYQMLYKNYIARYHAELAAYIRRLSRVRRLRSGDPLLAARAFLGMVVHHFVTNLLFAKKKYGAQKIRDVSQTLARIWLEGMEVRSNGRSARHR